jgi:hypothetical protein
VSPSRTFLADIPNFIEPQLTWEICKPIVANSNLEALTDLGVPSARSGQLPPLLVPATSSCRETIRYGHRR